MHLPPSMTCFAPTSRRMHRKSCASATPNCRSACASRKARRITPSACGPTAPTSATLSWATASALAFLAGALPMQQSLEFFLGLLDADEPAHVALEDFEGEHGDAL